MINPLSVLIATPAYDSTVQTGYCGGLMACAAEHLFGNVVYLNNCTGVQLARDLIVDGFLRSPFEWLVFIDADIAFTAKDFKLLLSYPVIRGGPQDICRDDAVLEAESKTPLISCAEYARKVDNLDPARFGLGFCKIHKSVFITLQDLKHEDGEDRLSSFVFQGRFVTDFFPAGIIDGSWVGEDTGFFHLCRLAGIIPRIEQRTELIHCGTKQYPYVRPIDKAYDDDYHNN